MCIRDSIKRWAFKHPAPDDFFRTMENVSGEDLSYFWRGWFQNKWKIDQAVKSVKYKNNDYKSGSVIKLENIGQLPMPVKGEITFKDGSKQEFALPVEVWKRNSEWTFELPTNKEIASVKLDPKGTLPDADPSNNTFKFTSAVAENVDLKAYQGTFSSKDIPLKIVTKVENGKLTAQATGQQPFPLEYDGEDKFVFELAQIELAFNKDKKGFTLNLSLIHISEPTRPY